MSYETVTVRMNRSSSRIPWGFTVRGGSGIPIQISFVEKESLADKAGIQVDDTLAELSGRNATSLSLQEARSTIERPSDEIHMLFKRYVTSHPSLPWTLTEQDNKIVVDEVRSQDAGKYKALTSNESRNEFSAHSKSSYEAPRVESSNYHSSSYSKLHEDGKMPKPVALGYEPAPFSNVTNSFNESHSNRSFANEYTTNSYTKKETHSGEGFRSSGPTSQPSPGSRNIPIAVGYGSSGSAIPAPPPPPSGGDSFRTTITPMHVNTNFDSSYSQKSPISPFRRSGQSPRVRSQPADEGGHVPFQHSPRTARQLSPNASIRHLQYNSPMNLYSSESAAEQYLRQTGGLFGTEKDSTTHHIQRGPLTQHSPIFRPTPVYTTTGALSPNRPTNTVETAAQHSPTPRSLSQHSPAVSAPIKQMYSNGAIPAPPPPPPQSFSQNGTFSAKVNPIKAPYVNTTFSNKPTSNFSPVSPRSRQNDAKTAAWHDHADGPQVLYEHSPRTRELLSPQATIRHLQYNSPMNIYSIESANEQFNTMTGGIVPTETDANKIKEQDPSYLHSATRRLIDEEEHGHQHGNSPPAQSSSFKRISAACGTPVC